MTLPCTNSLTFILLRYSLAVISNLAVLSIVITPAVNFDCDASFKFDNYILIGAVYVPLQQSRFFNDDEFDLFEQEISSACDKDFYVLLIGDYNA